MVNSSWVMVTATGLSLRTRSVYALAANGAVASLSAVSAMRSGSQLGYTYHDHAVCWPSAVTAQRR